MGRSVDTIDMVQDTDRQPAVVNAIMKFLVPQNAGNFLTSLGTISFSRSTLFQEVTVLNQCRTTLS